jgi:glycosyltransferase involved in cell wall biosynthesis
MAQGVAPIVADYAGPSELVDDLTGIKVSFHDRDSLVQGFKAAIRQVVENPAMLQILGNAACAKVIANLTWEAKARQILAVYEAILARSSNLNALGCSEQMHSDAATATQPRSLLAPLD